MRRLLFVAMAVVLAFAGCSEKDYYKEFTKEDLSKVVSLSKEITPEFREGYNTLYMLGEDTVYYGNIHASLISSPIEVVTRANPPVFVPQENEIAFSNSKREGLLLFEDIIKGDFDYNDFICEFKEDLMVKKPKEGLYEVSVAGSHIKPVAMGNTIPLSFGFEIRDYFTKELLKDVEVFGDIRSECFNGAKGFINTVKGEPAVGSNTIQLKKDERWTYQMELRNPIAIAWYIKANGYKHYTVDATRYLGSDVDYTDIADEIGRPYGVFIPFGNGGDMKDFRYMAEKAAIWNSYTNFNAWVRGEYRGNPFVNPTHTENLYK